MMNLVEKFTPATDEVTEDDGVVAIEYVIVAAALVAALGALWALFGNTLATKLDEIVDSI